jgi:sugar phosphate isomerase/epimerase
MLQGYGLQLYKIFQMKLIIESDDRQELLRHIKSLDMAICLFEIVNNAHRHKDTLDQYRQRIIEVLEENQINIDELID